MGKNKLLQSIALWAVLMLGVTAEGWMNLLCRFVFRV